jgi:hypothetical protein
MAYIIADRVKQQSTSQGTGNIALGGSVTGFQTFSAVCTNGDNFHYAIVHLTNGSWETGLGTWYTGNVVTRSVLTSSSSNALVDFAAGSKEIFITPVANNIVVRNNTGAITPGVIKTVTVNFGNVPVYSSSFVITDSAATTASLISINASGSNANSALGGDELEMDNFSISAYSASAGNITVSVVPDPGPVKGSRNFNYIVGSGV